MGRRMLRTLGAGLMEAGRQGELFRKEALEKARQKNVLDISNNRLGLMREQFNDTKKYRGKQESSLADKTFYDRIDSKVKEAYGMTPMGPMQSIILKAALESESGMGINDTLSQLRKDGLIPKTMDVNTDQLNNLYNMIRTEWSKTVGKTEGAGEFNMNEQISRFPLLLSGVQEVEQVMQNPESEEAQAWYKNNPTLNTLFANPKLGVKLLWDGIKEWASSGAEGVENMLEKQPISPETLSDLGGGDKAAAAGANLINLRQGYFDAKDRESAAVNSSLNQDQRVEREQIYGTPASLMYTPNAPDPVGPPDPGMVVDPVSGKIKLDSLTWIDDWLNE